MKHEQIKKLDTEKKTKLGTKVKEGVRSQLLEKINQQQDGAV